MNNPGATQPNPGLNHTFSCLLRPFFGFETGSYSERRTATYFFSSKECLFWSTAAKIHTPHTRISRPFNWNFNGWQPTKLCKDIILGKGLLSKQVLNVLLDSMTAFQFNSPFQGRIVEFSICPPVFLVATHISRTKSRGKFAPSTPRPWGKLVSCKWPFSPWVWQALGVSPKRRGRIVIMSEDLWI